MRACELGRCALGDDLARRHDRDRVGETLGLLDVVRRHQHRHTLRPQAIDQRPQLLADLWVQAHRGLVEQHQARAVDQAACDQQPPSHSARQLAHDRICARAEVGYRQRPLHRVEALGARHPVQPREHRQDLAARQLHVEVVQLGHHPHLHASLLALARQLVADHFDPPPVGDQRLATTCTSKWMAGSPYQSLISRESRTDA